MKKILITGAGSYIGGSVGEYLARWPEDYQVDTLSVRGEEWKNTSFQSYDAVLHVAGIVHQKKTKDDPACWEQYRQVNVDLAVETAKKAKAEGGGAVPVHEFGERIRPVRPSGKAGGHHPGDAAASGGQLRPQQSPGGGGTGKTFRRGFPTGHPSPAHCLRQGLSGATM